MDIHTDIPTFLGFGKLLLRVFYEGQFKTCRRCNSPDHLAKDCNNTFCFNCDSMCHVSKQCPSNVKCCIFKEESHKAIDCQLSWSWRLPSQHSPDPKPAAVSVAPADVSPSSDEDNKAVTSDTDLWSVMDFQRQEDGDVPASISDIPDDDDDDDDAADDDDDDGDDVDSCDEIVARLHADYDDSEEDPSLGPRKRAREEGGSLDLFSKSPHPQGSEGSSQSLQESQVPPVESLSECVPPPEPPT